MMTAKRLYKLIISAFVTALCFVVFSLPAFADPLTGAMISAGLADGFVWGGMAGMSASGVSDSLNISGGYTDSFDWTSGNFNVKITSNSSDNTKVDIEISPDLATVGYNRIDQFNAFYNLSPGTLHSIGTFYGYRGYDFTEFYKPFDSVIYLGPIVDTITFDGTTPININVYSDFYARGILDTLSGNTAWYNFNLILGNKQGYVNRISTSATANYNIRFGYHPISNTIYCYKFSISGNSEVLCYVSTSNSGVVLDNYTPSVERESESVIVNPNSRSNIVTLPATYVQNITYVEGEIIDTRAVVEEVLDAITTAGGNEEIDDSIYLPPPGPTPVPGDTIADTPYSDLHGDLGEVNDTIGIGNGILEDIKDILDNTTDGLKDTVEDISDALTNTVDGIKKGVNTISQTLASIASHVAQLVQEIVDADYNWTSGVINNFFNAFTDWFSTLRSHVSIWHYVVEWLSDISTCFAFFWGVQSAAGYRFILPIYAAFAGTVVIAIYRRFGK